MLLEIKNLETWANSYAAPGAFPNLVQRLIRAVVNPKSIRFPKGAAVWREGFDGRVSTDSGHRFVPQGDSVWEISTRRDVASKASEDFNKRSTDSTVNKKEITFVFVTPRFWDDKDKYTWLQNCLEEDIWRDVRVIDGQDLVDWLDEAEAVGLAFAGECEIAPRAGLDTLHEAWEKWSSRSDPRVSHQLALAGRGEQVSELITRLSEPPSVISVQADTHGDAFSFVLAVLSSLSSDLDKQSINARAIVAEQEGCADQLRHFENLVLILERFQSRVPTHLPSSGTHVIVPLGNDRPSVRNLIKLPRPTVHQFAEVLEQEGLEPYEASRLARACGRSATIYQRQKRVASFDPPGWAQGNISAILKAALLIGRWNHTNAADQAIFCKLAGLDNYDLVDEQLRGFWLCDDPPLRRIDEMWTLTAPVDAFDLLARRLDEAILERFKEAFIEVFGRIDPRVELPPDERLHFDGPDGRPPSEWLRYGLAETFLLIAERGEHSGLICQNSVRAFVERIAGQIPGLRDDWRVLASLRDHYERLMEGAPRPLLDSLEYLLEAKPEDVARLFVEGENILASGGMHTGLLWGLELLAWDPEYLNRVTRILIKLASIDPGGRLTNRPLDSLRQIYLWWHPGTNASSADRLAALDLVLTVDPKIGWDLLVKLLPDRWSSAHDTAKPRWRDVGELHPDSKSRSSQFKYAIEIINRAVDQADSISERWEKIFESFSSGIGEGIQLGILAKLENIDFEALSDVEKTAFWNMIRDFVYRHKTYEDAEWALPVAVRERLESILPQLAPKDLVEQHCWLFDEWMPESPSGESDYKNRESEIGELRRSAVSVILRETGPKGIVRLAKKCKLPQHLSVSLLQCMNETSGLLEIVELALAEGENGTHFAARVSGQASCSLVGGWNERLLGLIRADKWSTEIAAELLSFWPDTRETWENVCSLGPRIEEEYWKRVSTFIMTKSPEDLQFVVKRLIAAGRASEIFKRFAISADEVRTATLLEVFDETIALFAKARTVDEIRSLGLHSDDFERFLEYLRSRDDVSRADIANREYTALPLLGLYRSRGLTLHEYMAESPEFFVKLLCDAFLPQNRDKEADEKPNEEVRARAENSFKLLHKMRQIPGIKDGTDVDQDCLSSWIDEVLRLAENEDRLEIAENYIGQILANSPIDPVDLAWPHRAIRIVIEEKFTPRMIEGFLIGKFNLRGTVSKGHREGGVQERELAMEYSQWANAVQRNWPRTHGIILSMIDRWNDEARREDDRVSQDEEDW